MAEMNQVVTETGHDSEEISGIENDDVEQSRIESGLSHDLRRLLILLLVASAMFALFYFTPVGAIVHDVQALRAYLRGDDLWAELTFAAMAAGLVSIGAPRLIFYGIGGLAFGFWQGLILAQLGSLLGSFITFYAVRHGGRDWLLKRFGHHRFVGKAFRIRSSIKAVVLIRQLPLHSLVITGGLALSEVSARIFLLGSFIGFLPQGVIATLISSGIVAEKATESVGKLVIAAVILLSGIGLLHLKMRHSAASKNEN
jgi:uncharacterized membrane protein YdjX (TVP38/TMEM64 family)